MHLIILLICLVSLCESLSGPVTLSPPLPPTKVNSDRLRYYSFGDEAGGNNKREIADWGSNGYSSGDPFEVPSLSAIAEMMRQRDRDRGIHIQPQSSNGWGWTTEVPTPPPPIHHLHHHSEEGWGWPSTTPRPPPPPTEAWGWHKVETTTEGWSHHSRFAPSYGQGGGSFEPVDNKPDTGWGPPKTTTPKYNPKYLSSDEAKYKPIRFPPSTPGWTHPTKPTPPWTSQHQSFNSWPSSPPRGDNYGGSSRWNLPYNEPRSYPSWPKSSDHDSQGSYWYSPSTPSPHSSRGWGWTTPKPPTPSWGWHHHNPKENDKPKENGFEYKPGEDDLNKNIFPGDIYERSEYPPGIGSPPNPNDNKYLNSFEDDSIPRAHNHYRIVPYTPSPEEQFRILKKTPPSSNNNNNEPNYGNGDPSKNQGHGNGPFYNNKSPPNTNFGDKDPNFNSGGGSSESGKDNKWFVNNFHRTRPGPPERTTVGPPTRSRTRPTPTPPQTIPTQDPSKTFVNRNKPGGESGGSNSVGQGPQGTTEKNKRPRYDEHGFKYIPVDHPIGRRISNPPRDIYEDINQPSESRYLGGHIQLWKAEDSPQQPQHFNQNNHNDNPHDNQINDFRGPEPEGDFVPNFGPPHPPPNPYLREPLMERINQTDAAVKVKTAALLSCPAGQLFSKKLQKCEKLLTKSTTLPPTTAATVKSTTKITTRANTTTSRRPSPSLFKLKSALNSKSPQGSNITRKPVEMVTSKSTSKTTSTVVVKIVKRQSKSPS